MTPTQKRDLKELTLLRKSRGWSVLLDTMNQEVVAAAMAIASTHTMSMDEINFRRGSIWAAQQLLALPDRLIARLEAEEALTSTTTAAPLRPGKE